MAQYQRYEFDSNIYLQEIWQIPVLIQSQTEELITRYRNGDLDARRQLVEGHLGLVVHIVKRYCGRIKFLDFFDLVQEGNLALLKAVEGYDFNKSSFSTYAGRAIEKEIQREIIKMELEVPENIYRDMIKYKRFIQKLNDRGYSIPNDQILCKILHISNYTLDYIRFTFIFEKVSMHQKVNGSNTFAADLSTLEEFLPEENDYIGDVLKKMEDQKFVEWLRKFLPEKQFQLIYFQVVSGYGLTDQELADMTNTSRQSWGQARGRAFTKLRNYYANKKTQV